MVKLEQRRGSWKKGNEKGGGINTNIKSVGNLNSDGGIQAMNKARD